MPGTRLQAWRGACWDKSKRRSEAAAQRSCPPSLGPRDQKRPAFVQRAWFKLEMVGVANLSSWRSPLEAAAEAAFGLWSEAGRFRAYSCEARDDRDPTPARRRALA